MIESVASCEMYDAGAARLKCKLKVDIFLSLSDALIDEKFNFFLDFHKVFKEIFKKKLFRTLN